jgi:hypothetical protein
MRNTILAFLVFGLLTFVVALPDAGSYDGADERYKAVERVSVQETRSKVLAGEAVLVCAYNDKRCEGLLLEGALTRREFEEVLPAFPKEKEIIIYCS